jgi:hypothetical protein
MTRQFGMGCAVAFAIITASSGAALALGPVATPQIEEPGNVLQASFFGRPYPYGYTGWGPCIRYVEVQTPRGIRIRRVRVCR